MYVPNVSGLRLKGREKVGKKEKEVKSRGQIGMGNRERRENRESRERERQVERYELDMRERAEKERGREI